MKQLIGSTIVLAVVPVTALNAMQRPAFIGYYLGVVAMWAAFVIAAKWGLDARGEKRNSR